MATLFVPQPGRIELRDKLLPTERIFSDVQGTGPGLAKREECSHLREMGNCVVSRGWAKEEVVKMKARFAEKQQQYGDIWQEGDNTAQTIRNVAIKRSGHDRWGVRKIPLVACDDFLKRVYFTPWYGEWADLIEPILARLDPPVRREQLIRCLFAGRKTSSCVDANDVKHGKSVYRHLSDFSFVPVQICLLVV